MPGGRLCVLRSGSGGSPPSVPAAGLGNGEGASSGEQRRSRPIRPLPRPASLCGRAAPVALWACWRRRSPACLWGRGPLAVSPLCL
ncbi:Protein of unknown function [Gryllus bimaculatus]|nr:Protein of unknown function [Gryllus bimaculatus]